MTSLRASAITFIALLAGCGHPAARGTPSGSSDVGSTAASGASTGAASSGSSSSGAVGTGGSTASSGGTGSGSSSSGAGVGPVGCFTDVSAGHHVVGCDGGIAYDVEIPTACTAGGCGVILDVHGLTMNANEEDQGSGMRALGDEYGYVVIQPTAPVVLDGWSPSSLYGPLLFGFVQDAVAAMDADPNRLHAMGFSEGGAMTWWMICAHSEVFASAAPLSAGGVVGCTYLPGDVPSQPIPILQAHGELDTLLNYTLYAIPQLDAVLGYWGYGSGTVFAGDAGFTATRYFTDAGIPYEFYSHEYVSGDVTLGGHCQPGGSDVGTALSDFGCAASSAFPWGQVSMQFFIAHPKP